MKARTLLCIFLLIGGGAAPLSAQDSDAISPDTVDAESKVVALVQIIQSIETLKADLQDQDSERSPADLEQRLDDLERNFLVVATGIDPNLFYQKAGQKIDWKAEVEDIFSPILVELRKATAHPREVERLRSELAYYENSLVEIEEALQGISLLRAQTDDASLEEKLTELDAFWQQESQEFQTARDGVQLQLAEKEQERTTIREAAQEILRVFFRSRGRNLFLALLAFVVTFLILRFLHRLFHRYIPAEQKYPLLIRAIDILYYVFTFFCALSAMLAILYLAADWVLLGLVIIFLVGLAWAAKYALPRFMEHTRLLLNLGPIREGERVIYNEIPWLVETLNVYTDLYNPLLEGGRIRLPLKDLIGLRSRPFEESEPWFPTRKKDWIFLSDGFYGEVVRQTPEQVTIATMRGSHKIYPTADFLHQHPRNLTIDVFAVKNSVRLDLKYRDIVNSDIAPKLKQAIEDGIKKEWYGEYLLLVLAELEEISESALTMLTIGKFSGEAASEYFEIGWKLQQIAIDACNTYGWDIPVPQLRLHGGNGATREQQSVV